MSTGIRSRCRTFSTSETATGHSNTWRPRYQWSANVTGGEAERLQGMRATANLFTLLGTPAPLGRTLVADDERGAGRRVVVLSYGLWKRRYGGSRSALGSTIVLNGDSYTIVGVLPRAFVTPVREADLVAPFPTDSDPRRNARDAGFLRAVGRLRPGVSIAQASADLDAIVARLRSEYPATNAAHAGTNYNAADMIHFGGVFGWSHIRNESYARTNI